jgi:hypothetical protein
MHSLMETEHIYIGDEFADQALEPRNITKKEIIRNRVTGSSYELTFYDEGFLNIRESRKGKNAREHMIELRFLDASPRSAKRQANGFLFSALGAGVLALLGSIALPITPLAEFVVPSTILAVTLATVLLLLFIYRSQEIFQFRTKSGMAVVVRLSASFGCIRKMRKLVRNVKKAIEKSRANIQLNDTNYLRAEMKAHYKLAETGVITREACSNGTAQILSKFG